MADYLLQEDNSKILQENLDGILLENQSPTVALNTPADVATGVSLTPALLFTGTDTESNEIQYNVQVHTDNTFATVATYYFDGSDVAASDTNSVWTNDANAFDGSTSTSASTPNNGTVSTNYLGAAGTNAPTSGLSITQVRARGWRSGSFVDGNAAIYTGGLGELLGTVLASLNYGSYITLSVPTGGWTWLKVAALETKLYFTQNPDGAGGSFMRVEIEVTSNPLLDKLSVTPDATFTGTGDPHPWPSGNQVTYTVQAGDTLTASTTYYWRARGTDPLGSNTYGDWSTTRSFTTTAGGGITVKNLGLLGVG